LNRVGNWYLNNEDIQRARTYHREALDIFQGIADTRGVAESLDLLGMVGLMGGDFVSGFDNFQQAVDLYQTLGDRHGMAAGWISMYLQNASLESDTLVLPPGIGSPADGAMHLPSLAQELGWRAGEALALWVLGEGFAGAGDYRRALELEQQAIAIAADMGHQQWLSAATMLRGAIHADLLDYAGGQPDLVRGVELAHEMGSLHWTRVGAGFLASTLIAQNELTRAQETLDRYAPESLPAVTLGQRQSWTARVELALARHDTERALGTLDHLLKSAANLTPESVIPRLWMLRAQVLMQLDRPTEAEKYLLAARANLAQRPQNRLLWRVECVLSQCYRMQNRHAESDQAAETAMTVVNQLADTVPDANLRAQFVRRAGEMINAVPS
jgi:tetratricopeptide (TPR) repeat protein